MEIVAQARSVRMSPRKLRLVADAIRHLSLPNALSLLAVSGKRATLPLEKAIRSAIANAGNTKKLSVEQLTLKRIEITEGQALKRFHPSSRGRVHPYKKRSSHIRIVLTDDKSQKSQPKADRPLVEKVKNQK